MNKRALLVCLLCLLSGLSLGAAVVGAAHVHSPAGPEAPNLVAVPVGLIVDEKGLDGDLVNQLCYQGLLMAEGDLGVVGAVYTPTDSSDYGAKIQQCADEGNVLCIASTFSLREAVANVATSNPAVYFTMMDWTYDSYPANLRSANFAHDEVGYMAGTLAGLMTSSNVVGDIGGMSIPAVDEFVYAYRNGAQCANPAARVLIQYADNFGSPAIGAEIAQSMIARGADVIFAPAGGTGAGAVVTATQSGAWGIGVDFDYYDTVFGGGVISGADKLLSSAMKQFDMGVYQTISETVYGAFSSGVVRYGLAVDGVGLAPFHGTEPSVPQSVKDALDATRAGIISGAVDTSEDCREFIFTPLIVGK